MSDFFFRTEDIKPEEVLDFFVETNQDREIISELKGRNPVVVVGSRGVGKSFLLRVAQQELLNSFESDKIFPVYLTFVKSSLVSPAASENFKHWMLARICTAIIKAIAKEGLFVQASKCAAKLAGGMVDATCIEKSEIEVLVDKYENSWKNPSEILDSSLIPTVEEFKDIIEELAEDLGVKRFSLFIDEAAHIFLPEQQRQFFTLFRDLRSHCITCNAAVYPGVTSFGDVFQPTHDATMLYVNRDVMSSEYIKNMREIVEKQADSELKKNIEKNGKNFAILAYAASGNPRLLLKTLSQASKVNSLQVGDVIKGYYRTDVWSEHSALAEKYSGHKCIIDWGREFIEASVIPELRSKNDAYLADGKPTSAFFWIHRDSPEIVKEAIRVLAYTGIVVSHGDGIKASRSEIGSRYFVNLGCLFSLESNPTNTAFEISKALSPKRMTEYGANHPKYKDLTELKIDPSCCGVQLALDFQMSKPLDVLDITTWQKEKLLELGLKTVRDVMNADESYLKKASYVGDVRARRMRNAAMAAVLEYLSG